MSELQPGMTQKREGQLRLSEFQSRSDGLDPCSEPDYAPKVEALRRDYLEARLAEAEQETARVRSPQPD